VEGRARGVHRPGDPASESGIYKVVHASHREPHTVTAIEGEIFPACRHCKGNVRFVLIADAPHVTHDWDLAGPLLFPRTKSAAESA